MKSSSMNKQQPILTYQIITIQMEIKKEKMRDKKNRNSVAKPKMNKNTTQPNATTPRIHFQDIYQNFIYFPLVAYDFKENEIKCIFDTCKWHTQLQQQRENRIPYSIAIGVVSGTATIPIA